MSIGEVLPPIGTSVWAGRITAAWRASVEGILEAGRLLAEAKAVLPHGAFQTMVERELPFKPSTARMLMAVARDERISKRDHGNVLPASWRTLYELTKLPDEVFAAKLADGSIHPEMQRKDVAREEAESPSLRGEVPTKLPQGLQARR